MRNRTWHDPMLRTPARSPEEARSLHDSTTMLDIFGFLQPVHRILTFVAFITTEESFNRTWISSHMTSPHELFLGL